MLPLPPRRITSDQEIEDRVKTVRVRCDFNRILEIDLQKQTFTAALRIEASWIDDELDV